MRTALVFDRLHEGWLRYSLIGVTISGLFWLFFDYGTLKLTYDSFDYLEASKNVDTYFKGRNPEGYPYLNRAPFLYFFLNLFSEKMLAAWWLNSICFIMSLVLAFKIAQRLSIGWKFQTGTALSVALSYPWLQNHLFLWTEPLFGVLILTLAVTLLKREQFAFVIIISVLLFLVRKAGVVFFIGTAIYLLIDSRWKDFRVYVFAMGIVILAWYVLEIYFLKDSISLFNVRFLLSLSRTYYLDALTAWVLPRSMPMMVRTIVMALGIASFLILYRKEIWNAWKDQMFRVIIVLFFTYLLCFLILFGAPEFMEAERFISVVIPLFVLVIFKIGREVCTSKSIALRSVYFFGLVLWMVYLSLRTFSHL